MTAATASAAFQGWSVSPGIPGQFAPEWGGQFTPERLTSLRQNTWSFSAEYPANANATKNMLNSFFISLLRKI
ncbi:hypothetical protein HH214_21515 (plasmid) [Mucilaginibacter robiniae]|uniref:Uncharacterized protein n=1 Tax=Mucilaginibacter robiniae TaxID=2728022 RepID=A0A7L5E798_9SPHI|nr:hypothetical protein [Mucilaginibacter robiniae]QJD98538.1 hypothetical protein HH214_21515 [Mucilaginibacter robiniae]